MRVFLPLGEHADETLMSSCTSCPISHLRRFHPHLHSYLQPRKKRKNLTGEVWGGGIPCADVCVCVCVCVCVREREAMRRGECQYLNLLPAQWSRYNCWTSVKTVRSCYYNRDKIWKTRGQKVGFIKCQVQTSTLLLSTVHVKSTILTFSHRLFSRNS